ncbi:MAG: BlaI/MecI/CopY family transcriptional regulator [Pirellulales bacterium]
MARPASEYPTELELQILKILWQASPRMVRDVRKALAEQGRDIAHTSVITTLNTMVRKKFLKRIKQGNAFLFSPRVTQQNVSHRMLDDLVERVFDGSAASVMLSLFHGALVDPDELKELRRLINQKVKEQSP